MPRRIHKRRLLISFLKSGDEGLQYELITVDADLPPDVAPPPPSRRNVESSKLNRASRALRNCVERLMDAAREGRSREGIDLEATIDSFAEMVAPANGLASLLKSYHGIHPWMELTQPEVANIPWEAFPAEGLDSARTRFCFSCHVAHLVHSNITTPPPQGKEFLIIADPTGDLFTPENDKSGRCRQHIAEIRRLLQEAGYDVELLRFNKDTNIQPTDIEVLDCLRSPRLVGVYYFGHGYQEGRKGGCLSLYGGTSIDVSDILALNPRCRFVFINACHAAMVGQDWGFEKPLQSIAHAFATGSPAKVVVAPIWPVINLQAATMAVDFFRRAIRGCRLSKALRWARMRSYRRYRGQPSKGQKAQPDYCWAAYRYFGDPDRILPKPEQIGTATSAKINRIFDARGQLIDDQFSFSIDDVLLRAAKRRNICRRQKVTCSDFIAGLIRRGEMTRTLLRKNGIDPDGLYEQLEKLSESCPADEPVTSSPLELREELDRWIVRDRAEFEENLLDILQKADERAQEINREQLISETDVLRSFLSTPCWDADPNMKLPPSEKMRRQIDDDSWRYHIDADGRFILLDLDPGARKIVDTAHALSQLRGVCQIPSRLMLVAFLLDDSSEAVQLCEGEGVHIQSLIAVLLAATGGDTPQMFELGDFACSRIVKPTVIRARQLVDKAAMVREADLFRAFCEVAPQEFKHLMKVLPKPWQIDLDSLYGKTELDDQPRQPPEVLADSQADISPGSKDGVALGIDTESVNIRREQFEPAAWRVILLAANWSLLQRSPQLRSPHLFAALIGDGSGPVGIMLRRANLNPEVGKILVLMMIPPPQQTTEISKVYIGQNAAQVMLGAITAAQKHGRSKANVDDLIQSLLANGGGSVGEYLRKLGVDIRPWWYSFGGNGHNGNGRER